MILKTEKLQEVCKCIVDAVDTTSNAIDTETLDLRALEGKLCLSVTNHEYFVTVSMPVDSDEELHATISAKEFLQLIALTTTEDITINVADNYLSLKCDGNYKFPLIYKGAELLELTKIDIQEVTNSFVVSNDILQNILKYNTKELQKSGIKKPVQKMFYIDEKGAITFASGACVTSFTLDNPVQLLLSEKLVKLFKLFTTDKINVDVGFNEIDGFVQTRVRFKNEGVELTAIANNEDSLLNSIPVDVIRKMTEATQRYRIVFSKQKVLSALNRLSIFSKSFVVPTTCLEVNGSDLTIYDTKKVNHETITLEQSNVDEVYSFLLHSIDLKITLDSIKEDFVTLSFGNNRSVVIDRVGIKNLLPEMKNLEDVKETRTSADARMGDSRTE